MNLTELAERFSRVFAGLPRAHGIYDLGSSTVSARGKVGGKARTVMDPVTVEKWIAHLSGTSGIGIIPLRDDGTVVFAAIDIDDYKMDLREICAKISRMKLPVVPCRTKSGGVHLYLFGKEPLPAGLVRRKLMEWATNLGFGGSEIFPKQERLASTKDVGNWINVPYFDCEKTLRYAMDPSGDSVPVEVFLEMVDERAVSAGWLESFVFPIDPAVADLLKDGPPCLQSIAQTGAPEGTRNKALFNFAIYAKKRWPDDWERRVDEYNAAFMTPALPASEVAIIVKSIRRKTYNYTCKDSPCKDLCNRPLCVTRQFGVGQNEDDPGVSFGSLTKIETDPPIWIWEIDGIRMEVSTDAILSQSKMALVILEKANKILFPVQPGTWRGIIQEKLDNLEIIDAPEDAGIVGQILFHLDEFCSQKRGRSADEIIVGRVHHHEGRASFRSTDFIKHLKNAGINNVGGPKLWGILRSRDAKSHRDRIKGRQIRYWSVVTGDEMRAAPSAVSVPDDADNSGPM